MVLVPRLVSPAVAASPLLRRGPPISLVSCVELGVQPTAPAHVYGPELHPEQAASIALVTLLLTIAYVLWDRVLVPQKRLELSRSKRAGDVSELLDKIEEDPSARRLQSWFFSDWLEARQGRREKKAAVPFLPKTKFNSGDNPVLGAVAAIMLMGGLSTLVKEVLRVVIDAQ